MRFCPVPSVAARWAWRAIWAPLPCHVPCEVLSAWPLWSPVATEGLQHSTSSPGSWPQKRKFGSFKWRGCSRAIYSTGPVPPTIFHMRTSVCGACSDVCAWVGGYMRVFVWMQVLLQGNASSECVPAGACVVSIHTNSHKSDCNLKHGNETIPTLWVCVFTSVDILSYLQGLHSFTRASGIIVGVGGNSLRVRKQRHGASD